MTPLCQRCRHPRSFHETWWPDLDESVPCHANPTGKDMCRCPGFTLDPLDWTGPGLRALDGPLPTQEGV